MPNRDMAEKFIKAETEAWINGNVTALDEIDAPEVVYHLPGPLADIQGIDIHKTYILSARKALSDIKFKWQYVMSDGNIFAVHYEQTMTVTGDIPGFPMPPVGAKAQNSVTCIGRIKNNKIVEVWMVGSFFVAA